MRVETHHYTDGGAFEQSLDVYRPGDTAGGGGSSRPVVALVVGSTWLGHRPSLRGGTGGTRRGPGRWRGWGTRASAYGTGGRFRGCSRGRPSRHSPMTAGLLAWLAGALLDVVKVELAGREVGGREVFGTDSRLCCFFWSTWSGRGARPRTRCRRTSRTRSSSCTTTARNSGWTLPPPARRRLAPGEGILTGPASSWGGTAAGDTSAPQS